MRLNPYLTYWVTIILAYLIITGWASGTIATVRKAVKR